MELSPVEWGNLVSKDRGWNHTGTLGDQSSGNAVTEGPDRSGGSDGKKWQHHRPQAWAGLEAIGSHGGLFRAGNDRTRALLGAGEKAMVSR